jgi:hypothetical protein
MSLYTLYPCKADGVSASFEVFEFSSDADLNARAEQILIAHPSCAYVNVWQGDRKVLAVHRTCARERAQVGRDQEG